MEKIRGYVSFIRYPREGLNYEIPLQFAAFDIITNKNRVNCAGYVPYISRGDYMEFAGDWDGPGQKSFSVKIAVRCDDDKLGATSMLAFVFGGKTTGKILDAFQGDACRCWFTFKEHPDVFANEALKIKGIGEKKLNKAFEKWENYSGIDVIFKKYEKYGMSVSQALKVYQKWGKESFNKIKEDPYVLKEVNLEFALIDKIALKEYGLPENNPQRVYTGAVYAIKKAEAEGHCYVRLENEDKKSKAGCLKQQIKAMLNLKDTTIIDEQLLKLFNEGKLIRKKHGLRSAVYFPDMEKAEVKIAQKVTRMLHKTPYEEEKIDEFIQKFEEDHFKMDILQKNAIKTSVKNQFSIISGPPGAGKTTIIDAIVEMLKKFIPGAKVRMCSPTGKAAQRMKESTREEAATIHRMLSYDPVDEKFKYDENNPIDCDVLIVDEFSMCGVRLFSDLLAAIPDKCHVVLVGDKDQLPSIEPGKVLQDLLSQDFIPKTILTKVYRQAEGSAIYQYASDIREENLQAIDSFKDAADVKFHEMKDVQKIKDAVVSCFIEGIKEYGIEKVCIMTPTNKNELGTIAINELIQEKINPQGTENELKYGKQKFRLKDRVIQVKNEPNYDVFNGDTGTIIEIRHGNREFGTKDTIVVDFGNDNIVEYHRDRFENLKLAYCLTIHKLQGSEYPLCILILHSSHIYQMEKRLIYTAWTRARKQLDVFGEKRMIRYAVLHKSIERHSMLIQNLKSCKK